MGVPVLRQPNGEHAMDYSYMYYTISAMKSELIGSKGMGCHIIYMQ